MTRHWAQLGQRLTPPGHAGSGCNSISGEGSAPRSTRSAAPTFPFAVGARPGVRVAGLQSSKSGLRQSQKRNLDHMIAGGNAAAAAGSSPHSTHIDTQLDSPQGSASPTQAVEGLHLQSPAATIPLGQGAAASPGALPVGVGPPPGAQYSTGVPSPSIWEQGLPASPEQVISPTVRFDAAGGLLVWGDTLALGARD